MGKPCNLYLNNFHVPKSSAFQGLPKVWCVSLLSNLTKDLKNMALMFRNGLVFRALCCYDYSDAV